MAGSLKLSFGFEGLAEEHGIYGCGWAFCSVNVRR